MRVCLVVPGGVDSAREDRRIPCLQWTIERLARRHDVEVFALRHHETPEHYDWCGARVHAMRHHGKLGITWAMLRAHRRAPFDVVHAFWASWPGLIGLGVARLIRRSLVVHVAGGELACLSDIEYGTARTWRGRAAVKTVLRGAAVVTVASVGMERAVAEVGVSTRRVPLGVDLDRWPVREPPEVVWAPYRLVHVASLNRVKNQTTLLRAVTRLHRENFPFVLDVIGVDTMDGHLQQLTRRLGIADHVRFHGWLPPKQVRTIVSAAHLHLLTSRHEAGPVAVREAAASGVPTVGTKVGHVEEWYPEGAVALSHGDDAALAREIRHLLRDDKRRVRLAKWAQRESVRHDADWSAEQFDAIYRQLTKS